MIQKLIDLKLKLVDIQNCNFRFAMIMLQIRISTNPLHWWPSNRLFVWIPSDLRGLCKENWCVQRASSSGSRVC